MLERYTLDSVMSLLVPISCFASSSSYHKRFILLPRTDLIRQPLPCEISYAQLCGPRHASFCWIIIRRSHQAFPPLPQHRLLRTHPRQLFEGRRGAGLLGRRGFVSTLYPSIMPSKEAPSPGKIDCPCFLRPVRKQ